MRNTLTIQGGGITVRGTPTPGAETGIFLKQDGFQGWDGRAAGRREAIPREASNGEHDVPVFLPGRVITLDVWILASSLYDLGMRCRKFEAWGATGAPFTLTVDHQEQTLHAEVRSILATTDDTGTRYGQLLRASGQAQLFAAEAEKYGEENRYPTTGESTSILVSHRGTVPAPVIVEISAAPSNYSVTTPAGTFTVAGATAGGTHRIDTSTGQVTRNGVWMQRVGSGPLWKVPPDEVWQHTLSVPGRVRVPDTFV